MKFGIISLPRSAGRFRAQIAFFCRRISDDLVLLSAAQASFFLTASAVPFLSLLMALTAILLPGGSSPLSAVFPDGSGELLRLLERETADPPAVRLLSFHAAAALWTASRGVHALRSSLERIYGGGGVRHVILRRLSALPATFGMLTVLAGSVLALFSGRLSDGIPEAVGAWFPFLVPASVLTLAFVLLYAGAGRRSGLNGRSRLNGQSGAYRKRGGGILAPHLPGAFFAASGWMLFSLLFSYYIGRFPQASAVYGSLGAICLLMLWLYFCTIIFLLGAEINLLLAERKTAAGG